MTGDETGSVSAVSGDVHSEVDPAFDPEAPTDVREAVARERDRVATDLRGVVAEHLHHLESLPDDGPGSASVARHAAAALDAVGRAADLGGLRGAAGSDASGGRTRGAWLVLGTLVNAAALALLALVVVLLPASVALAPLFVLGLALAVATTARHAPPLASAVGLLTVLGVLVVAAPFATTAAPAAHAVAGTIDLPTGATPESGACLLLGVVLAAAWALGYHRRRRALAARRRRWLGAVDALGRCDAHGRLGLSVADHHTLVDELAVLCSGTSGEVRRARVARHRLVGMLPALTAGTTSIACRSGVADSALDEARVAVLVATSVAAAPGGARRVGRPPSVVVCGVPATTRPEVGLLAARLLADLVTEVAAPSGPVPAGVAVEHRAESLALEVACGRGRLPGSGAAGRVPTALAERAAVLGGTVVVTATSGALAVQVVLPTGPPAAADPVVAGPAVEPVAAA